MQSSTDTLQRFLFKNAQARGEIVRLNKTYSAITERPPYPLVVQKFLGQALAASALLSATIKFEGRMTLQVQCDGPIRLVVAQSDERYHVRGLAKWQQGIVEYANFTQAFGKGRLAITITPKIGESYQGMVALDGIASLAEALENYFHQSEQLPSCLCLFANAHSAGGILLQALPADTTKDCYAFWQHLMHLTRTLTAEELLNLSNQTILQRLYHEEDIILFDSEAVSFHCDCSVEKMEGAVIVLGELEANDILKTHTHITVTCEFCHSHYDFDKTDAARIFAKNNALDI